MELSTQAEIDKFAAQHVQVDVCGFIIQRLLQALEFLFTTQPGMDKASTHVRAPADADGVCGPQHAEHRKKAKGPPAALAAAAPSAVRQLRQRPTRRSGWPQPVRP